MKITKSTIIRTIVLAVALTNQILTATGHSIIPIDDAQVTELISLIFTVGASLTAWWKNNSFTKKAIEADETLKALKENVESPIIENEEIIDTSEEDAKFKGNLVPEYNENEVE